jgi:hypothetical protein
MIYFADDRGSNPGTWGLAILINRSIGFLKTQKVEKNLGNGI